ncbi:MAG: mandelate racemase/muconate lactonizing enzyme family protein [Arenicellales bacterium]|jgi:2-dehydro-3-deoxyphosphogalactonate aldolase|nr:mandelate racemase/muconate lactonizing enzyme family protein [Arenicellales bacterium]MDP6288624.1 mandelate racemase/muconate lactonizing enzyme family protein [Arenicellales bacterium]MDP7154917.1 mandelate racemase/muconate lactonizing enzyme family protein [Arenicellales bacterium]MDP7284249.1 mandelate racemase/muconate lactonizing enzyme family protein [Arenicellales bacterium]MDP7482269.1 mandelate racemase/muconate lactonizing enzyme family protein [Arenicellales bacterium]|tara:strand:+ start:663 stop:1847 length:1185 start_codon:yes stop_codon:yes gene_type:complete
MKISDIKTFVVGNPPPHFGGRYWIFLKLIADNGVVGYGEVYAATFGPHVITKMIEDVCQRHVIGSDPFKIEKLWRNVYGSGYTLRPDVSLLGVLSGIEMACWDIIGKELDKPVYELLGGKVHEKLRSYTYLYSKDDDPTDVYHDADLAAERAAEYVEQGFTAVKFDPAGAYSAFDPRQPSLEALDLAEEFVRKIRAAVGVKADILFGTHGQFTASGAIRLAKRLEAYDPLWLEEPTPPENPREMARVARHTSIPIATGERLTTKYEFARVLEVQAASILQMALGRVGGILEAKKIAGMAETHYAQIAPHLYCGPIEGAANIQISTCSPNFLILESIQKWDDFHAEILKKPIQWEKGFVIPPSAPGLGIELDEEVALAHPYQGEALHLEMADRPI